MIEPEFVSMKKFSDEEILSSKLNFVKKIHRVETELPDDNKFQTSDSSISFKVKITVVPIKSCLVEK